MILLTLEACAEHAREIREGKRSLNSRYRSRCSHCGNLFTGPPGSPCPLAWTRNKCAGILEENKEWRP